MRTFRNQMQVKFELNFAEWPTSCGLEAGGGGVRTSKRSGGRNVLKICTILVLVFYYSSFRNTFTTAAFLFNKLTYKSSSYASTHCIHPSLLMTSWLTATVFPVKDLFCRKKRRKSTCLWKLLTTRRREGYEGGHFYEFQSRLKPVDLIEGLFTTQIFPI